MKNQKNEKNLYKFTTSIISLLLGIVLILISIIFDMRLLDELKEGLLKFLLALGSKCVSAVGVSLVVGFITSKIQSSEKIISKQNEIDSYRSILREEIISKNFILHLSQDDKNDIVRKCILKDDVSSEMKEYVLFKSNHLKDIADCTIRSNIDYMTQVSMCDNLVKATTEMSYRIYPNNGKYSPIKHCFDKSTGKIISMKIINEKGVQTKIKSSLLMTKADKQHCGNEVVYTNSVDIPPFLANEKFLTVKIKVEEYGNDHWIHLCWMSLYPTDTISYKIICKDGLIIKNHMVFDQPNDLYLVELSDDLTQFTISCEKWTDPYTGFSLIVSKK